MVCEKREEISESNEPRKSQRIRKEKYLDSDFVLPNSIVFFVEGDGTKILNRTPLYLIWKMTQNCKMKK